MASTAAPRAFGVVELLEEILLRLDENSGDVAPAIQLFALQRVNTTFRDTIGGSKKLRQRMGLEVREKLVLGHADHIDIATANCIWLFKRIFNPISDIKLTLAKLNHDRNGHTQTMQRGAYSMHLSRTLIPPEGDPSDLLTGFLRPEASWRKMIANKDPRPRLQYLVVTFDVAPLLTRSSYWTTAPKFKYADKFSIGPEDKLEDVWENYVDVFRRSYTGHVYAKNFGPRGDGCRRSQMVRQDRVVEVDGGI